MKKINRKIFGIILIIFSFLQILYICRFKNKTLPVQNKTYEEKVLHVKEKDFYTIIQDINKINNVNITEATEDQGVYYIKVKLSGDKDNIMQGLSGLRSYNINEYNINHTASNNSLILEIVY